jgi:hypothetical protein
MKISLKNVKTCEFASEETTCFEATVYVDGKRAFTVANDGRGGCNEYHPIIVTKNGEKTYCDKSREMIKNAEEWCKTLPKCEHGYDQDLDDVVNDALYSYIDQKIVKRDLNKKVTYLKNGKIMNLGIKPNDPRVPAYMMKNHPEATVLNNLPIEEVVAIYKKHGVLA